MTIQADGNGIWGTHISYKEAATACLPVVGIGIALKNLGEDFDARVWNLPGTEQRLRLLKRQCIHGACGVISSLLTLILTIVLVATGFFAKFAYALPLGCGLSFCVLTQWPPFNHIPSLENQARETELALENRMQG
jgi:hypothetical protein